MVNKIKYNINSSNNKCSLTVSFSSHFVGYTCCWFYSDLACTLLAIIYPPQVTCPDWGWKNMREGLWGVEFDHNSVLILNRAFDSEGRCIQLRSGTLRDLIRFLCGQGMSKRGEGKSCGASKAPTLQGQRTTALRHGRQTREGRPHGRSSQVCQAHPPMPEWRCEQQTNNGRSAD